MKNQYILNFLNNYHQDEQKKVLKYIAILGIDFLSKVMPSENPV
jgi:hypothetical protein